MTVDIHPVNIVQHSSIAMESTEQYKRDSFLVTFLWQEKRGKKELQKRWFIYIPVNYSITARAQLQTERRCGVEHKANWHIRRNVKCQELSDGITQPTAIVWCTDVLGELTREIGFKFCNFCWEKIILMNTGAVGLQLKSWSRFIYAILRSQLINRITHWLPGHQACLLFFFIRLLETKVFANGWPGFILLMTKFSLSVSQSHNKCIIAKQNVSLLVLH